MPNRGTGLGGATGTSFGLLLKKLKMENKVDSTKQGRGRPKKSDTRKPRTIWMNDEEYLSLSKKSKKANIDFSKYCREILLKKKPIFYGDGYKAVFNEIHKQGVNLNQAVKSLNEISITHELSRDPDAFAESILKNQSEILNYLKSILENDRQDS